MQPSSFDSTPIRCMQSYVTNPRSARRSGRGASHTKLFLVQVVTVGSCGLSKPQIRSTETYLLTDLLSHSRGTPLSHLHCPVGQLRSRVVGPEYVGHRWWVQGGGKVGRGGGGGYYYSTLQAVSLSASLSPPLSLSSSSWLPLACSPHSTPAHLAVAAAVARVAARLSSRGAQQHSCSWGSPVKVLGLTCQSPGAAQQREVECVRF